MTLKLLHPVSDLIIESSLTELEADPIMQSVPTILQICCDRPYHDGGTKRVGTHAGRQNTVHGYSRTAVSAGGLGSGTFFQALGAGRGT